MSEAEMNDDIELQDDLGTAEDRAKTMGWRPKEEFKGQEDKWVDAEEFVKRADEDPREARKTNHVLMRKLQKLEQGQESILSHHARELAAAEQKAYNDALESIKNTHDSAIHEGDLEKANSAWQAREEITKRQIESVNQPRLSDREAEDNRLRDEFVAKNEWLDDPEMSRVASEFQINKLKRGVSVKDSLEMTAQFIRKKFPHEFEDDTAPPRDRAPSAVRSNNGIRRDNRAKAGTYEALTPQARTDCDRAVRTSGGKITKEAWLSFATPDLFQS